MTRAVGFDLDDTLAVPERDRATLLAEALERAGSPALAAAITREDYVRAHRRNLASETREPVFADLVADHAGAAEPGSDANDCDADHASPDAGDGGDPIVAGGGTGPVAGDDVDPAALAAAYREVVTTALRPVEGAEELVKSLRDRGYRVGLLTDGPSRAQRRKLAHLGWEDLFDAVMISGEIGVGKPDRAAFRALVEALDATPETTVYVGDNPEADVAGAAAARLRVVQVLDGDDSDPRADRSVDRAHLSDRLPAVLADLTDSGPSGTRE